MAVSSGGFSRQATEKARKVGIEALTFRETDTRDWRIVFGIDHVTLFQPMIDVTNVGIHLSDTLGVDEGTPASFSASSATPMFRNEEGNLVSALRLWDQFARPHLQPGPTVAEQARRPFRVRLNITDDHPLWLVHGGQELPVVAVEIAGEHWVEARESPLVPAREYVEADSRLLRGGVVETAEPVCLSDRAVFVSFVYIPNELASEGATLSVVLRDAGPSAGEPDL